MSWLVKVPYKDTGLETGLPPVPPGGQVLHIMEMAVPASPPIDFMWNFRRLHVPLQIAFAESTNETRGEQVFQEQNYETEAEAAAAVYRYDVLSEERHPLSYNQRMENVKTTITSSNYSGTRVGQWSQILTTRSVMPLTMQVIAELIGNRGIEWSQTFEVAINFNSAGTTSGDAAWNYGSGYTEGYADLVNPVSIISSENLTVRLSVRVPASVTTGVGIGFDPYSKGGFVWRGEEMTLYYDEQPEPSTVRGY